MTSRLRAPPLDLAIVVLLGAATCAVVNFVPGITPLRAALALPFLLVGIGHVVSSAVFGAEPPETAMRLMLIPALSIASIILMALLLDVTGLGLDQRTVADGALILAAGAALIAAARRRGAELDVEVVAGDATFHIRVPRSDLPPAAIPVAAFVRSRWTWSVLLAAAVFAGLLVALARPLPNNEVAGYTALAGLRGPGSSVRVDVLSNETRRTTYRLRVLPAAGTAITRRFSLAPGASWIETIALGSGPPLQTIVVRLYRAGAPGVVYRQVSLRP